MGETWWNPVIFHLRVAKDFQKAYLPMRSTTLLPFPLRRTQHSWWCEENGKTQKTLAESWRVSYLEESFWCLFPTVIIFQSNFWIFEISKSSRKNHLLRSSKETLGFFFNACIQQSQQGRCFPKSLGVRLSIMLTVFQTFIHLISYLDDPSEWFRTLQWSSWYILYHTRRWHISSNEPSGKPTWATRCACGSSKPLKLRSISRSSPVLRSENRKICLKPIRPMFGQHMYIYVCIQIISIEISMYACKCIVFTYICHMHMYTWFFLHESNKQKMELGKVWSGQAYSNAAC